MHILTEKGKGYKYSEQDIIGSWHGVGPFDVKTGKGLSETTKNEYSWSEIIGKYMIDYADKNDKFSIVIPAMIGGSKLEEFKEKHPNKIIDVGIAEQTAVTMSSGFALSGIDVFTPIYSTFIQRAYDQVNHDVARQNLKVVFGIDRAGIVGADGETHQGVFDIPLLRHIPNMIITHPRNPEEAFELLNYGFKGNVRELENLFIQLHVFGEQEIELSQLPKRNIKNEGLNLTLAKASEQHIKRVLQINDGNIFISTNSSIDLVLNTVPLI